MGPSKPTIIFVPGGWHSPEIFSTVRASLESHGYRTIGVSLPSVGAEPPVKSWDPDVEAIRSAIKKVVDEEGGDVVLAMHSYGGLPSSEAAKGFAKTEREREGMKGGVVRLVYICAALMDVGKALSDPSWQPEGVDDRAKVDGERVIALNTAHYFYNDLPPETADYWSSKLKHHSLLTLTCPVTYAAWRHIPATYLLCEADNTLRLPVQEAMVETVRAAGVDITVERCKAGHSPFLSMPDVVVGLVRRAAGEEGVV